MIEQKYIDRFHTKYVMEPLSGCWLWTGKVSNLGYGQFMVNKKMVLAHRFSAMIHGMDMSKPQVRHLCNNPSCVNPAHLTTGTHSDNMKDKQLSGRASKVLTEQQVVDIRLKYNSGTITLRDLATVYGVSNSHIYRIVSKKNWSHI